VNFALSRLPNQAQSSCIPSLIASETCLQTLWSVPSGPSYRLSGLEWSALIPNNTSPLSITLTLSTIASQLKGVEVYDAWGELCGSVYADGFTSIGTSWVFLCVNTPLAGTSHTNATLTVRLLGQESIYDVPDSNLNSKYLFNPQDPLFPYLPASYFTQFANTTWPLTGSYYYDVLGLPGPITWPNRQRLTSSLITTFPFTATYNYTVASNFRYVFPIYTEHLHALFSLH